MSYQNNTVEYRSGHLAGGGVEYTKLAGGGYEVVASGGPDARITITDIIAGGSATAIKFKTSSNESTSDANGNLIAFVPAAKDVHYPYSSAIRLAKGDTLMCDGSAGAMIVVHYRVD